MKSVIVDTNAILRFLLNDIPEQNRAFKKILHQAKQKKITLVVLQIVIFEIDFILEKYYQFPKETVINKLKPIISSSYLQVQNQDTFKNSIELYEKQNISFVDCFLFCKAKEEGAELFTFNKKLQKLQQGKK